MIYKRFAARLKAQDWLAILIEVGIVVVGVFIGTLVANANQQRLEREESRRLLIQIQPDLNAMRNFGPVAVKYYGATRRYAATALAGWRGDPAVSDTQFVIAAYQASQVIVFGFNADAWASALGLEQVRAVSDPELRRDLTGIMSTDFAPVQLAAVSTPYRQKVREVIPLEVAETIIEKCGDRIAKNGFFVLPPTCDIVIDPGMAKSTAARLRARPELAGELAGHFSQIAIARRNATDQAANATEVSQQIDRYVGRGR